VFVDAMGDGDLGAISGCRFDVGHSDNGDVQQVSLMALVMGLEFSEIEDYVGGSMPDPKKRLAALMEEIGVTPSYGRPTLFRIRDDISVLMRPQ
jgi:hypothetical protein